SFFFVLRPHSGSTLFPYTTLFRSVSGGVSEEGRERMASLGRTFNLKLVFSTKSGAYLSDVGIIVIDAANACSTPARMGLCSMRRDRKSTRLNSSHSQISYAVFCLK